jgi:hypothetical protein
MVLKASFVRTAGERDRIYVTRSDGSSVSWVFPSYGDGLPHDLVHLVAESAFGLADGFWGRVDGGAEPGAITREANRKGGRDKYAAYGTDQSGLQRAEAVANVTWLDAALSDDVLLAQALAACRAAGVAAPPMLNVERVREVRTALAGLARRWRTLLTKGALDLEFDGHRPQETLEGLLTEHR